MKPSRLPMILLALTASAALSLWAADDGGVLPKGLPAARYDTMAARSPFTAPTAVVTATPPPVAAGPRWWDQMYLTSLMDRGGVYYIGLVDKASSKHYLLATGRADEDSQLLLNSVQWNDHLDQTTATVSKGAETAPPIRFDATAATAAPANPAQPSMVPPRPLNNMQVPALPPGFNGVPPAPPPSVSSQAMHRNNPIASRPGATPPPNQNRTAPQQGGPRRIIVPNGDE